MEQDLYYEALTSVYPIGKEKRKRNRKKSSALHNWTTYHKLLRYVICPGFCDHLMGGICKWKKWWSQSPWSLLEQPEGLDFQSRVVQGILQQVVLNCPVGDTLGTQRVKNLLQALHQLYPYQVRTHLPCFQNLLEVREELTADCPVSPDVLISLSSPGMVPEISCLKGTNWPWERQHPDLSHCIPAAFQKYLHSPDENTVKFLVQQSHCQRFEIWGCLFQSFDICLSTFGFPLGPWWKEGAWTCDRSQYFNFSEQEGPLSSDFYANGCNFSVCGLWEGELMIVQFFVVSSWKHTLHKAAQPERKNKTTSKQRKNIHERAANIQCRKLLLSFQTTFMSETIYWIIFDKYSFISTA